MDEAWLADLIARHAVPLLVVTAALLLATTGVAWKLIEHLAPAAIRWLQPLWSRVDATGFAARYLGWHCVIGFVVAALGLLAFLALLDEIGAGEEMAVMDALLASALDRHLSQATLRFFAALTWVGDPRVLIPVAAGVTALLAWRREHLLAWSWVVGTGGGALLNRLLKAIVQRERPVFDPLLTHADGYSFPSGHASGSMLVFGLGAYLLVRHTPGRWHLPLVATALLLIVFVGASRVLLQVHYLSDVLAGWAVGAAWTALCVTGLEIARLSPQRNPAR